MVSQALDKLPGFVLANIFRCLSLPDRVRCERVCKTFRLLLLNSWRDVTTLVLSRIIDQDLHVVRDVNKVFSALLRRCGPYLISLDLSTDHCASLSIELSSKSIKHIAKYCYNVEILDLSCQLDISHLRILAGSCCRLKVLKLRNSFEEKPDRELGLLLDGLPCLEVLDLSQNEDISGRALLHLTPQIKSICLDRCKNIRLRHLISFSTACPNLTNFSMTDCTMDISQCISSWSTTLKFLNLYNLNGIIDEEEFLKAIGNLPSLISLDLSHSCLVKDTIISAVSISAPNLQRISLAGKSGQITNDGLKNLSNCQFLEFLDLSWLEWLSDPGLDPIARNGSLKHLNAHFCEGFSQESLLELIKCCQNLAYIDLTGCRQISLKFLETCRFIFQNRNWKCHLVIEISDENLVKSFNNIPNTGDACVSVVCPS